MKFRMTLLAATVLAAPFALPTLAQAQPVTGPYVSGGLGYNIQSSQKGKNIVLNNRTSKAPGPTSVRIVTHNGWTGEGSVGYGFGNGFRVELEGDYYSNNFSKTKGVTQTVTSGKNENYGVFANGFYDFDVGLPYLFPYLGAGVGYQTAYFNGYNTNTSAGSIFLNKTRGAFAYQGIAGLALPIPGVPGLSATIEYRFMALTGSRKYNGADFVGGVRHQRLVHGWQRVQQLDHGRPALPAFHPAARAAGPGSGAGPGCCSGPGPGPNLPGVLRLG